MSTTRTPWLMEWPAAEAAGRLLVCCHHAGGGASQFRAWQERLAPDTAVLALQLPGRQNRWGEPFLPSVDEIVAEACEALAPRLDRPFTVFGHSMGGIVGYELVRRLGAVHGQWPERLVVSAARPPHHRRTEVDLGGFDDAQVLGYFVANGSLPHWVLDDADVQQLVLPPLRGDFVVCDEYRHRPGPPVPCPITVCGGTDDPDVTPADLAGWREYTCGGCEQRMFPGGHLYHLEPASGLPSFLAGLPAGERTEEMR